MCIQPTLDLFLSINITSGSGIECKFDIDDIQVDDPHSRGEVALAELDPSEYFLHTRIDSNTEISPKTGLQRPIDRTEHYPRIEYFPRSGLVDWSALSLGPGLWSCGQRNVTAAYSNTECAGLQVVKFEDAVSIGGQPVTPTETRSRLRLCTVPIVQFFGAVVLGCNGGVPSELSTHHLELVQMYRTGTLMMIRSCGCTHRSLAHAGPTLILAAQIHDTRAVASNPSSVLPTQISPVFAITLPIALSAWESAASAAPSGLLDAGLEWLIPILHAIALG